MEISYKTDRHTYLYHRYAVIRYAKWRGSYGYLHRRPRSTDPVLCRSERTGNDQTAAKAGIDAAKARGVRFGRPPLPLPDNFHEVHSAWRNKKITLRQAASMCQMPTGTFYAKAKRFEDVLKKTKK